MAEIGRASTTSRAVEPTSSAHGGSATSAGAAPRRILVAHLSIGGGHGRAADATVKALQRISPRTEVTTLDLAAATSPLFKTIYKDGYLGLVKTLPRVWGAMYSAGWVTRRGSAVPSWLKPRCVGRLAAVVGEFAPDAILATAAPVSALLSHLRETGAMSAPLAALITDYHAHPAHLSPAIDVFCVAGHRVAAGLRKLGAPSDRVRITGIPVEAAFSAPMDPARTRVMLGLDPRAPVVLVMGGALGTGRMIETIRCLARVPGPIEIITVAGKNEELLERLGRVRFDGDTRLHAFGFTDRVPEMMAAATLFVTKPGGMSTTEALCRGLPMVFVDPLRGAESRNLEFFVRGRCAVAVRHKRDLADTVARLLDDDLALASMRKNAERLALPHAADAVAAEVLALARAGVTASRSRSAPLRGSEARRQS